MTAPRPHLDQVAVPRKDVRGVVLVLHGGRADSTDPVQAFQLAVVRIRVLAAQVAPRLRREHLATSMLRFGLRGWNGANASPVADARWALEQLREQHGHDVPIVLVGHSMGGRTALRVAGDAGVRGVVALAPWLPAGEPVQQLTGRRVVIAHGDQDRITSPADSRAYAARAGKDAERVEWIDVPGDGHGLLRRAPSWNRIVVEGVTGILQDAPNL